MRTSLATNLRAIVARAYVRVVAVNRQPSWVLGEILLPLLSVSAYVYIYRALRAPPAYEGFVILGGAMTPFWLAILWGMASQFYWERESGNLDLYLAAPISRMSILCGMAAGSMLTTTTRAVGVVVAGLLLFDVSFAPTSWPLLVLTFLLTMVALYGMGMLGSSVFLLFGREAWHLMTLCQEPVYLLSGFFFPVRALGKALALVATLLPLTLGLDAIRQNVSPEGRETALLSIPIELLLLTILSALFLVLAQWSLAAMENRAKREGRLSLRWE